MIVEEREMKVSKYLVAVICLLFGIVFCAISIYGEIFHLDELPSKFMAAFLGAIITANITYLLLNSQSSAQELKQRNVKIFKKKSLLYEKYIEKLYQIIEKQSININDLKDIESEFYSKIILYLKKKFREKILCCFENITDCVETSINNNLKTDEARTKTFDKLRGNLTKIINLLVEDLGLAGRNDMDLLIETEKRLFPIIIETTLLQEVINCFSKEKELSIKIGAYAKEEDGVYIILVLLGKNSHAGEIYIGPFVYRDMGRILMDFERLHLKVEAPQFNPVADLYTIKYGSDKEKCFISLEKKGAEYEYVEKGFIDLSRPLDDDAFEDSELDRNMYNNFIPPFNIEYSSKDKDSLYSRYHGIYQDVCKAIAKRAYHYFRKTYAVSQEKGQLSVLLKELCIEMGRVTESKIDEYMAEKKGISYDSEEDEDN